MIFLQPLPQTSPSLWSPPPLFVFIFKQHKHNMKKSTLSCITRLLFSWMGKQTHRHIFMLCNLCSIHTTFWAVQILLHYFWRALVDTGQRAVFLLIFSALTLSRVLADFPALHFWRIHRPLSSDGYSACVLRLLSCVYFCIPSHHNASRLQNVEYFAPRYMCSNTVVFENPNMLNSLIFQFKWWTWW